MMGKLVSILLILALLNADVINGDDEEHIYIWPKPGQIEYGHRTLTLDSSHFQFAMKGSLAPEALTEAFHRYLHLIFCLQSPSSSSACVLPTVDPLQSDISINPAMATAREPVSYLNSLLVDVQSLDETLKYGVDESYTLEVPSPANSKIGYLKAKTIYGALRGLETFSQLCSFNYTSKTVVVHKTPWVIFDEPRFSYRGLLIDTSRHFQPVEVIKKVIDAMSYAKLNVLHWHIVDTQSFPLEIPSYPKLWYGSYSERERYTIEDAQVIVEYAKKRGIHVMPELDSPGHAASWGKGYPELWPSVNCTQPLDVSKSLPLQMIDGIVSDFSKLFPFDLMHMGGDEVNTSCWSTTSHVKRWLRRNKLTEFDAYKQFVLKVEAIAISHGFTPVNWEEPFNEFGSQLNKNTIIHNWLGPGVAPKVVKRGFRCIVSNQDVWYLDHLDVPWESFYMNEPLTNITNSGEQKLVIGGEVCMWGETVDPSDIEQTIWPRAAAAAERLWTSYDQIARNPAYALRRLQHFRCLLNRRGVAAAPVQGYGRDAPPEPDSCFSQ